MTTKTYVPQVSALFDAAADDGVLSPGSVKALNVIDIGQQIQDALGVPADDVTASEVVLVTMLIDDSGSIRFGGNVPAVRDGHNGVLQSLAATKQCDGMLLHTRYLNGQILFPYALMSQTVRMDATNYHPDHATPLYDETLVTLGTVLAKTQEFIEHGVPVRTITLIVTDGCDTSSRKARAADVRAVVRDMLRQENHLVAAMGVDDGSTDFRLIFAGLGIRDEWILTPGNSPSEIRKAFAVFSQSAVRASQNAQSFTHTALGGFGSP